MGMDREMKMRAWRRLHMEQPYSMTNGGASGGLVHLYAGLQLCKFVSSEAGGKQARKAIMACRLIERRVLITRDEVHSYLAGDE